MDFCDSEKPDKEMTDEELAEETDKLNKAILKRLSEIAAVHLTRKPYEDMADEVLAQRAEDIRKAAKDGTASTASLLIHLSEIVAVHLSREAKKPAVG